MKTKLIPGAIAGLTVACAACVPRAGAGADKAGIAEREETAPRESERGRERDGRASGKFVRIMSVTSLDVRVMESHPEQLHLEARGRVRTGGWQNPTLRATGDGANAASDVLVFEFAAEPPPADAMTTQMVTPVTASITVAKPPRIQSVRVVSETNSVTVPIR